MTICIATREFGAGSGGIGAFYRNLASLLCSAGNKVIVLTMQDSAEAAEEEFTIQEENLTIVRLNPKTEMLPALENIHPDSSPSQGMETIEAGYTMLRWLLKNHRQYEIDIIETVDAGGAGIFLVNPELPPVVVCGHGSLFQLMDYDFTEPNQDTCFVTRMERMGLQFADLVITHSELNMKNLLQQVNTVNYCSAAWTNPANEEAPIPFKRDHTSPDILIVGRLQSCKGIRLVAEAVRYSVRSGNPMHMTWIGGDTYTAPGGYTWSAYLRRNYGDIWQKNLLWAGHQSHNQVLKAISESSVVVVPSRWETFSFVALEAIALNKPLVISETAGAASFLVDRKSALVIPATDARALVGAINELTQDAALGKRLAKHAAEMVKQAFQPWKIVNERMEAYGMAIEKRKDKVIIAPGVEEILDVFNDCKSTRSYRLIKILRKIRMKF